MCKGLYGLKQSGRLWNQKLTKELELLGFTAIKSDPAVYIMEKEGVCIIMPVFVDDITITSKDKSQIQWVKDLLAKVFKLKDLGLTKFLLGIQIDYNQANRTIALSQCQYILDILTCFKMSDCTPVSTPMDPGSGSQLSKYVDPANPINMSDKPYMSAVGALLYLAIGTRPDIMFTVAKLAQYNANPGPQHWQAVKHVMRYLQGTKDLRLTFRPNNSDTMSSELCKGFSDADHAGDLDTRCSTSGFLVRMGTGTVCWSAKKQTVVANSSTEAEFVSMSSAGCKLLWLCSLLGEIGMKVKGPTRLMVDNQSALRVLRNPEHHRRMKHIDIKWHWIQDSIKCSKIEAHFIPTGQQVADIFTKALPCIAVEKHQLSLSLE